ncbi:MAG TPA: hypothetical protein PLP50_06185 [Thermoanaerobaculia bacterium]|nr:hypothetical protein [Thermoanaerobaculia bacterium]HPA51177.1 hypothetical protein [Thermoanaerobaculia bacterium]HQN07618.1 hypothetical protein [Thermoanaerobaculia bacterium]HQP86476.1 hypothetical protein [Thermoanaerobaculia bacterium]
MKGDALPVLWARGLLSAARTWKALLLALALNAALALVVTAPLASRLHDLLDERPTAAPLANGRDLVLEAHLLRAESGLLGGRARLEALGRGELLLEELPLLSGPLAGLLTAGLLHAALSGLLAGGFAGRFASERDRGSLAAFLSDVVRLGLPSLVLGLLGLAGILGAFWVFVELPRAATLSPDLRWDQERTGLSLLRLGAFLLAAGAIRAVVAQSRAALGLSRSVNPLAALGAGLGFVLGRPVKALLLEVAFGATALLPLALWLLFAPSLGGGDLRLLATLVAGQQVVVLLRIASRTAHLGAASAWMRGAREASRPAPAKIES